MSERCAWRGLTEAGPRDLRPYGAQRRGDHDPARPTSGASPEADACVPRAKARQAAQRPGPRPDDASDARALTRFMDTDPLSGTGLPIMASSSTSVRRASPTQSAIRSPAYLRSSMVARRRKVIGDWSAFVVGEDAAATVTRSGDDAGRGSWAERFLGTRGCSMTRKRLQPDSRLSKPSPP
jgi:hypothetical protein